MQRLNIFLLFLLSGCGATNPWSLQSISGADPSFDTSRLRFISAQSHQPIQFELIKMGNTIESFLSLKRFHFSSEKEVKITLVIENEKFEDFSPVYDGGMKVRFRPETTQKIIQALQEGHKVAILVDGFEEILDPSQFSSSFSRLMGEGSFFLNLLKGASG